MTDFFDYCFAENGLVAFKLGQEIASQSFIGWLGEEKYKKLANFVLHYIADLDIPVKRCGLARRCCCRADSIAQGNFYRVPVRRIPGFTLSR